MTDRTSYRREVSPNPELKCVALVSGTTVSGGADTLTLTLADYGISKVLAVQGFVHTTEDSVIINSESITTAVSSGVLTVSLEDNNNYTNKKRVILVYGE